MEYNFLDIVKYKRFCLTISNILLYYKSVGEKEVLVKLETLEETNGWKIIGGKKYCTVAQAAKICNISTSTMRRWADPKYQAKLDISIEVLRDPVNNYRYLRYDDLLKLKDRFIEESEFQIANNK